MATKNSTSLQQGGPSGGKHPLRRASVRAALMAGVASVGIAAAVPHGVTVPNDIRAEASMVAAADAPRVSTQEVQLAAYVPVVYEVGSLALSVINAVDSLLTAGVDLTIAVTSRVPLVSALAPQISYVYFCVARSFVYYPLAGAAHFATTLNPFELVDIGVYIADRLTHFVRFEIDYFANLPRYLLGFQFLPGDLRPPPLSFGAPTILASSTSELTTAAGLEAGPGTERVGDEAADAAATGEEAESGAEESAEVGDEAVTTVEAVEAEVVEGEVVEGEVVDTEVVVGEVVDTEVVEGAVLDAEVVESDVETDVVDVDDETELADDEAETLESIEPQDEGAADEGAESDDATDANADGSEPTGVGSVSAPDDDDTESAAAESAEGGDGASDTE